MALGALKFLVATSSLERYRRRPYRLTAWRLYRIGQLAAWRDDQSMGVLGDAGVRRLEGALGVGVAVESVLVDLPDRAALRLSLDGRHVLLKVDSSPARSDREVMGLRRAGRGGVSVPEIVWHEAGPPALLALGWVEGTSLAAGADAWREVGEELHRLHEPHASRSSLRFDHRGATWNGFLRWWLRDEIAQCVGLRVLSPVEGEAIRTRVVRILDDMAEPPRRFLHGDLQPEHVIKETGTGRVVIVDWGDAGSGDALWDLAVLALDHRERLPEVLIGYQPIASIEDHIEGHLDAYRLLRYLGEITWLLARGFDASVSISGLRSVAASL